MNTAELIRAIRAVHPGALVEVTVAPSTVHSGAPYASVSVRQLPSDLADCDRKFDDHPNHWRIHARADGHTSLYVDRYNDDDIDAALVTALAVLTAPSVVTR